MIEVSILTSTYNRSNKIKQTFHSLETQTFKEFEWIIIDDGSTDDTKLCVSKFKSFFPIKYFWQNNSGKHIAINRAIDFAKGKYLIVLDSDDTLIPTALETLIYFFNCKKNEKVIGIKCTTLRSADKINGHHFKRNDLFVDLSLEDFIFKYNYHRGEMLLMIDARYSNLFKSPSVKGLKYYPETIIENEITKKFLFRFVDVPVRIYIHSDDSIMKHPKNRCKENLILWTYCINNFSKYLFLRPKQILKYYIGFIRDSMITKTFFQNLKEIDLLIYKIIIFILIPIGFIFFIKEHYE